MNTDHLRYLLTIAECHSISRASEQLQLKQQYLSNLVRNMEKQFGTEIFKRHRRGISLTEDGQYLLGQAKKIVELADTMEQDYLYPSNVKKRNAAEEIIICVPPLQSHKNLFNVFRKFRQQFPNVRLVLQEKIKEERGKTVKNNKNAVAFHATLMKPDEVKLKIPEGMKAIPTRKSQMIAVTSANNPMELSRRDISCKELVHLPLATYAPWGIEYSAVWLVLKEYGDPNIVYVLDNSEFLLEVLAASDCYALMERKQAVNSNLVQIPLKEDMTIYSYLVVNEVGIKESLAIRSLTSMLMTRANEE